MVKKEINFLNKTLIGDAMNFHQNESFFSLEKTKEDKKPEECRFSIFENFINYSDENQSSDSYTDSFLETMSDF